MHSRFLFRPDADTGKLGALFWCAPENPRRDTNHMIPIHTISKIHLGTEAPVFDTKHGKKANARCCVSLYSSSGRRVHLETNSVEYLSAWMFQVQQILALGNIRINLEHEGDVRKNKSRAFSTYALPKTMSKNPMKLASDLATKGYIPFSLLLFCFNSVIIAST